MGRENVVGENGEDFVGDNWIELNWLRKRETTERGEKTELKNRVLVSLAFL